MTTRYITERFLQEEIRVAKKERQAAWKIAEDKNQMSIHALETRIANAVLTSCDNLPFHESLRNMIRHNPEGPWVVKVRCRDDGPFAYDFAGFVSKEHRETVFRRIVTKYHGEALKRIFPTSDGWDFDHTSHHDVLNVRIPKPAEPDLLDLSTPCPFGLDESS